MGSHAGRAGRSRRARRLAHILDSLLYEVRLAWALLDSPRFKVQLALVEVRRKLRAVTNLMRDHSELLEAQEVDPSGPAEA